MSLTLEIGLEAKSAQRVCCRPTHKKGRGKLGGTAGADESSDHGSSDWRAMFARLRRSGLCSPRSRISDRLATFLGLAAASHTATQVAAISSGRGSKVATRGK